MKTEIELKLEKALILEIKKITEAKIDGIIKKDFQVVRVDLSLLTITSPNEILKGDYANAKEIQFLRGQIRVSESDNNGLMENMYYFDGTATVSYLNNSFLVNVSYITIYTN